MDEGKEHKVTAFNEVIQAIIHDIKGSDTNEKLLSAPAMTFVLSSKHVVTSVVHTYM